MRKETTAEHGVYAVKKIGVELLEITTPSNIHVQISDKNGFSQQ